MAMTRTAAVTTTMVLGADRTCSRAALGAVGGLATAASGAAATEAARCCEGRGGGVGKPPTAPKAAATEAARCCEGRGGGVGLRGSVGVVSSSPSISRSIECSDAY